MRVVVSLLALVVAQRAGAQHEAHRAAQQGTGTTLGTVVFPNSGSAAAQPAFLRGMALLHSFTYDEAAESFEEAEKIDPSFALPYWFEAFTNSHLLWGEDDPAAARRVLAKLGSTAAARLAKARTDRERNYGAAIEAFYAETTLAVRERAFADSMRHLAARYPRDLEAAAFASLALQMASARGAEREEAITLAERVFRESPNHPGGAHYLIHATDAPTLATRGLAAARAYAKIAADAEHALHMPSHIFVQLGLWDDAVASNERAWIASRAWVKRRGLSGAEEDFHDLQWLQYAYLQQGRYAAAKALIDTARHVLAGVDVGDASHVDARYAIGTLSFQYAAETGDWSVMPAVGADTVAPAKPVSRRAQVFALIDEYQRAMTAAMRGDSRAAADSAPAGAGSLLSRLWARELPAVSALKRGDRTRAIALLREGAAIEDSLAFYGPPPSLMAHELLGSALLDAGEPSEAVAAYESSLKLTPNRSAALLGLARARAAMADSTGATAIYKKLLTNWHAADEGVPGRAEAQRWVLGMSPLLREVMLRLDIGDGARRGSSWGSEVFCRAVVMRGHQ